MQAFGANVFELWAIGALRVAEKLPEAFGPVEDLAAYTEKEAAFKAKRDELCGRIGKEFAQGDLEIGEIRSDGAALITFKLASNRVPISPQRDCGTRLVTYLCDNGSP